MLSHIFQLVSMMSLLLLGSNFVAMNEKRYHFVQTKFSAIFPPYTYFLSKNSSIVLKKSSYDFMLVTSALWDDVGIVVACFMYLEAFILWEHCGKIVKIYGSCTPYLLRNMFSFAFRYLCHAGCVCGIVATCSVCLYLLFFFMLIVWYDTILTYSS